MSRNRDGKRYGAGRSSDRLPAGQPQRHVRRLHGGRDRVVEVVDECAEVDVVAEPRRELLDDQRGVAARPVESAVDGRLDARAPGRTRRPPPAWQRPPAGRTAGRTRRRARPSPAVDRDRHGGHDRVRHGPAHEAVDLEQPVAQDRHEDRGALHGVAAAARRPRRTAARRGPSVATAGPGAEPDPHEAEPQDDDRRRGDPRGRGVSAARSSTTTGMATCRAHAAHASRAVLRPLTSGPPRATT
jgi:hypothetical protein